MKLNGHSQSVLPFQSLRVPELSRLELSSGSLRVCLGLVILLEELLIVRKIYN